MGQFNTLGETRTGKMPINSVFVTGIGSDLSNREVLKGRAKRKTITQVLMLGFIDIAKENNDLNKINRFWNTYYCQNNLISADGRFYGQYCKNRFCILCCSIRKAALINQYMPIIESWNDAHMVTLTVKSVKANQLKRAMIRLKKGIKQIIGKHAKQNQRGTGIKLVGIKSLESNFNPKRLEYNPHFHIIVQNKEMAEILVKDWMLKWKKGGVNRAGQKIEKIYNAHAGLMEVIKYTGKIFTEPDAKSKKTVVKRDIYLAALYNIYDALDGMRIFDRFGFNLPKSDKIKSLSTTQILADYEEWEFVATACDWKNKFDETFADYSISSELENILSSINYETQ